MTNVAACPPTLIKPFADPRLSGGIMFLEKSIAIIEIGAPIEMLATTRNRIQTGARPGKSAITTQLKTCSNPTERKIGTRNTREAGWLPPLWVEGLLQECDEGSE